MATLESEIGKSEILDQELQKDHLETLSENCKRLINIGLDTFRLPKDSDIDSFSYFMENKFTLQHVRDQETSEVREYFIEFDDPFLEQLGINNLIRPGFSAALVLQKDEKNRWQLKIEYYDLGKGEPPDKISPLAMNFQHIAEGETLIEKINELFALDPQRIEYEYGNEETFNGEVIWQKHVATSPVPKSVLLKNKFKVIQGGK